MNKICAAFLVLLLISCSKNESPDPIVIEPLPRLLVKELIYVDSTQTVPFDTIGSIKFEYDANTRLINIINNRYDPGAGTFIPNGEGITFTYSGSDTVAASCIKTEVSPLNGSIVARTKHFFMYDAGGRQTKDSMIKVITNSGYDSSVFTYNYTFAANMVNPRIHYYYPSAYNLDAGNNLLERDSRGNILRNGMSNPWYYYEYDNHINPLKKTAPINAAYLRTSDFFWTTAASHLEQTNNFRKIYGRQYDAAGNMTSSTLLQEFIYTYNGDGLPTSSRKKFYPSAPAQEKVKTIYKY